MTRGRYEIEFQGSRDGQVWVAYPFRFKPQALNQAPGIYAPYQPRFDWNLWFASLGSWQQNPLVPRTEERLLTNDPDVLALFAANPFPDSPPRQVRAVLWQYWFTSMEQKRKTGDWWTRRLLGVYAPVLERDAKVRWVLSPCPTSYGFMTSPKLGSKQTDQIQETTRNRNSHRSSHPRKRSPVKIEACFLRSRPGRSLERRLGGR